MSNDTRNYYERELDLIDFTGEHCAKILIGSAGKTTRTLDVNPESAAAIIAKLVEVFMLPSGRPITAPTTEPKARPFFTLKTGRDVNGNKVLKIKAEGHGFSIQTNGNLPQTHRDGVSAATLAEVDAYVSRHGTARQKQILGL